MSGKGRHRRAPSATPWDGMPDDLLTPAQGIVAASQRSIYGFRHERYEGDARFFNGYPRSECPFCGGPLKKDGFSRTGVQRYRCHLCGRISTPITGTIFDGAKLPVTAWSDFILQALSFESGNAMAREDRRADTTVPYWMAKLFAVLEGIQDGLVLSGRVWADEAFWPVAAKDAVHRADGTLPCGLSKNQMCIAVGTDGKRSLFVFEGLGKTSKARTWDAFGPHIAPGSTLVHDREHSHSVLVDRLSLSSESYDSRLLKGLPDDENPLGPVNRMCFMLKQFLRAHSGFSRGSMQGYLDLLSVAMNPPEDKLEKTAMVLDRAMRFPKTLRYRDFYNVSRRSEAGDC